MRKHYVKWTPEYIEKFSEFYKTHPVEETAKEFKLGVATCYFMASRYGITKRYCTTIWDEGDDYLVVGLDIERLRRKVIADKMDKTEKQINHLIDKLKRSGKYYSLAYQYIAENNHRFKG